MITYLLAAFSGPGAGFMWVITAVMAFALAVVLERAWMLLVRCRYDAQAVREALARRASEDAIRAAGGSPLGEVLKAGAAASGPAAAWDAMGAAAAEQEERVYERIPYLAAVANVATMLGLLGTVYGLILAFGALGDAAGGERALRLSEGISTAMATTAYGLVVGIPSLLAHAWLESRARAIMAAIEAAAGRLSASLPR